jgi:methionyl-tRNA formyltransferase
MTASDKRIAVFGCKQTTKFIIEFLQGLTTVSHIITIAPDLAAKNAVADYDDLTSFAARLDVPIYQAKSYGLTSAEDQAYLAELKIDIAFVIGWQRLIPSPVLDTISIGCFGMHGSSMNLPLGRGRSPMNWSIIEGRKVFYTNLFKYDSGVDSGDVVDTFKFTISEKDTAETMHFKNMLAMRFLIEKNLTSIADGTFTLTKQPDIEPTYYPKRTPADSIIDWTDDVFRVERFIRAVAPPFGGAFTFIDDERLTITDSQVFDVVDFGYEREQVGTIVETFAGGRLLVRANSGLLLIKSYKCAKTPKKGDVFHNNGFEIKTFPTNKFGNYDKAAD